MSEKTYRETLEEAQKIEQANQAKIDRYAAYQQARVQAAGKNLPAPIIKHKDGSLQWLNRAQRRKAKIR